MLKTLIKNNITKRKCFAFSISNGINKNLFNFILIVFMLVLPILSLADDIQPIDQGVKIVNPLAKASTIGGLIKTILEGVIQIGMPIIALAIIYCGFLFVSAQGNSEKLNEAKRALTYTLIGAALLLGSWGIAQLISSTVLAL